MKSFRAKTSASFCPTPFRVFLALVSFCIAGNAATITFPMTNSVGVADTNAFRIYPIGTVFPDGSWLETGVPIRIVPPANGTPAQTNLMANNYVISNQFIVNQWQGNVGTSRGILFAVPNSVGTYSFLSNVISGGNVYNYNGAQFVANYANIISALGFTPLATNDARGIFATNTIAPGSGVTFSTNGSVVTITSSGGGGTNTVSPGNTLTTVTTNGIDYAVSALSQTNNFTSITTTNPATYALTNDARIINLTNVSDQFRGTFSGSLSGSSNLPRFDVSSLTATVISGTGGTYPQIRVDTGPGGFRVFDNTGGDQLDVGPAGIIATGTVAALFFTGGGSGVSNVTALAVSSAVTNRWRTEIQDTNNANLVIMTNVVIATNNAIRTFVTNTIYALANTNGLSIGTGLTTSTNAGIVTISVLSGTTNKFTTNTLVAGSNITLTTNGSVITITGSASGGGISTLNGTGTNTVLYNSTNYQFAGFAVGTNHNINPANSGGSAILSGLGDIIGSGVGYSVIGGGISNNITQNNQKSTIAGGFANQIGLASSLSFIGGGQNNVVGDSAAAGSIAGGVGNYQNGTFYGFTGGGMSNYSGGGASYSLNLGGFYNRIEEGASSYSTMLGGSNNWLLGQSSVISGAGNRSSGNTNFIAGAKVAVTNNGVFAWGDGSASVISPKDGIFLIRSVNGVGINTNDSVGHGLSILGSLSAGSIDMMGATNIYRDTNYITLSGSDTLAINGWYVYQSNQYTNLATGATITNNSGTWVVKNLALTSIASTPLASIVSTNWTVLSGVTTPISYVGTPIQMNGAILGNFNSTSLWFQVTNYVVTTVGAVPGGIAYVATNGSDISGLGTKASPFLTPNKAAQSLNGNGRVILTDSGYYTSGADGSNFGTISFEAEPGLSPTYQFGFNIQTNIMSALSNGIWTVTLTSAQSNTIAWLTNNWNAWSPVNRSILLYQTNVAYGANNQSFPVPTSMYLSTDTNRCPYTPLRYAFGGVQTMIASNAYWQMSGATLYLKFAVSNQPGPICFPGTNNYESIVYNLNSNSIVTVSGLRCIFGNMGIDLSGGGRAEIIGNQIIGCQRGIANTIAPTYPSTTLSYVKLLGNEVMLSESFGGELSTVKDQRRYMVVDSRDNIWHDNFREGFSARNAVRRYVDADYSEYNGLPDTDWPSHAGFAFVDDGSSSTFRGCTTISNSNSGMQCGTSQYAGKNTFQDIQGCKFLNDYVAVEVDDLNCTVLFYNNFVDSQSAAVNVSTATSSHTVKAGGNILGANLVNVAVIAGNLSGNTTSTAYSVVGGLDSLGVMGSLMLNGTGNFGHEFWVHNCGTDSWIDTGGTATIGSLLTLNGGFGMTTNALSTLATAAAIGGENYFYNTNSTFIRVKSGAFSTAFTATNTVP